MSSSLLVPEMTDSLDARSLEIETQHIEARCTTGRAGVGAIKTSTSGAASAGVLQQAGTQVAQAIKIQTHRFGNFLEMVDP